MKKLHQTVGGLRKFSEQYTRTLQTFHAFRERVRTVGEDDTGNLQFKYPVFDERDNEFSVRISDRTVRFVFHMDFIRTEQTIPRLDYFGVVKAFVYWPWQERELSARVPAFAEFTIKGENWVELPVPGSETPVDVDLHSEVENLIFHLLYEASLVKV
ncbi:hypothetical protein [Pandoraea pnomenusa]|uniref:hypothetical protein n=1 Tax=Pandoraea pnomenusa TaxID=93220 RepID=UPI00242EA662|nr:hypothetical protein [Pandoraea pnomenusa]